MDRSIKVKLKIYLSHLLFIENGLFQMRHFYQTEQDHVKKNVGKEIKPKLQSRLEKTFMIYE